MSTSPTAAIPSADSRALPPGGEALMARAACRFGAVLAVPVVAAAWWLRGTPGALTALGAVVLVIAGFAVTGWSLHWAGQYGLGALQAVALAGFGIKLAVYAAVIVVLEPLRVVDGPVLAVAAAVALVGLLAYEVRLLAGHEELWFVQAQAGRPPADEPRTRAGRTADGRDNA